MNEDRTRDRELLLSPNEFSFVRDQATGAVNALVGTKKTLDPGDTPVVYDVNTRRFVPTDIERSKQVFIEANESSYVVLKNPSKDGKHPTKGINNATDPLMMGSKINIPGPVTFPLWPLQVADVVPGHQLRSNQYLSCKVYNEEAARANIANSVVKAAEATDNGKKWVPEIKATGQLIVIRGTDVSFYIPPTGIEVVPEVAKDGTNSYVREAVTLERLEYCTLLNENGEKHNIKGPAVVFPGPNEEFEIKNGLRKSLSIELNEQMGVYVKVIADYEEDSVRHKVGEELFITGADQKIYFPREEHQLVKYDDEYIYYAIAIPKGEGRYVLNKNTGEVETIKGPAMFLPDPRTQVVVRRVLEDKTVNLWFPGNEEALEINRKLAAQASEKKTVKSVRSATRSIENDLMNSDEAGSPFTGKTFDRRSGYTPPRTLTLSTKYDGVVELNPWTGYAVQIIPKVGERKVIVGPASILMDYDWNLEVLSLSTGTPKTDEKVKRTVYLRIQNNTVSDKITAITKDDIPVTFDLKYKVDFTGDPNKWFNVENPIALLTDRCRSMLYNLTKRTDVETFTQTAADLIRDLLLGPKDKDGKRLAGIDFSNENGMVIRDVTISPITINNSEVAKQLNDAQYIIIRDNIKLKQMRRQLEIDRQTQQAAQEQAGIKAQTQEILDGIKKSEIERVKMLNDAELQSKLSQQETIDKIAEKENARKKALTDLDISKETELMNLRTEEISRNADNSVKQFNAVQPQLIAAIQSASDKQLAGQIAGKIQPKTGLFGGGMTLEDLKALVKGTALEGAFNSLNGNTDRYAAEKR